MRSAPELSLVFPHGFRHGRCTAQPQRGRNLPAGEKQVASGITRVILFVSAEELPRKARSKLQFVWEIEAQSRYEFPSMLDKHLDACETFGHGAKNYALNVLIRV